MRLATARTRALGLLAALSGCAVLAAPVAHADPVVVPPALSSSDGLTVQSVTFGSDALSASDPRLLDVVVTTKAVSYAPLHIRVYLPADYATSGASYPVLYLLHGSGDQLDDAAGWTDPNEGNVAGILASPANPFHGIVVMPEAGEAGWYTDWAAPDHPSTKGNPGHQPLWETFHVGQLIPWVDHTFRTVASKDGRAVAGLSMGGFGALSYSEQFPQLFSAVGDFSGPADLTDQVFQQAILRATIGLEGTAVGKAEETSAFQSLEIQNVFGPYGLGGPLLPGGNWQTHNPSANTAAYKSIPKIGLYAGLGIPNVDVVGGSLAEAPLGVSTTIFHTRLDSAHVANRFCSGPGAHDWPWWRGDLLDFLQFAYGTAPSSCPNSWGKPIS